MSLMKMKYHHIIQKLKQIALIVYMVYLHKAQCQDHALCLTSNRIFLTQSANKISFVIKIGIFYSLKWNNFVYNKLPHYYLRV